MSSSSAVPALPAGLLRATAFPHPVRELRVLETALSWVVLTGDYAYKIKKPLHNDFIDAATLARREFLCREELRLNQRYSSGLYLDVVPIGRQSANLVIGGEPVVEYAVRMRQFSAGQELAQALGAGRVSAPEMSRLGADLAGLHADAARAPAAGPFGAPALIGAQIEANFAALRAALPSAEAVVLERLKVWTHSTLAQQRERLLQRWHSGQIRECHGDLHAGNLLEWQGRWRPFDCLEFDPALRWIDVLSDVAFVVMDLDARGHTGLGHALLSAYLEHSGDYDGLELLALYAVYRALVRAKVALLRAGADALRAAQCYLQSAQRFAQPRRGALLLMHGVSGSGKSWLSEQLVPELPALRMRSDRERERGAPRGATRSSAHDRYSPQARMAVYQRLCVCAASALRAGYCTVVDATFLQASQRAPFWALAQQLGCPMLILACHAPRALLEQRLRERRARAADPSQATAIVLSAQLRQPSSLRPSERSQVLRIDTSAPGSIATAITELRARLAVPASAGPSNSAVP